MDDPTNTSSMEEDSDGYYGHAYPEALIVVFTLKKGFPETEITHRYIHRMMKEFDDEFRQQLESDNSLGQTFMDVSEPDGCVTMEDLTNKPHLLSQIFTIERALKKSFAFRCAPMA